METNTNSQNIRRTIFIDIVANMLEVLPGDILIMRPRPNQHG